MRFSTLVQAMAGAAVITGGTGAAAALVNYSWTVVINETGPGTYLAGMEGLKKGDVGELTFTIDTGVADSNPLGSGGVYANAVRNIRYRMPRTGFFFGAGAATLQVFDYNGINHDEIRIEVPVPESSAKLLIWLRSANYNLFTTAAIPGAIDPSVFEYTRYVGFYTGGANILGGVPHTASTCPADLNADGLVEDADFVLFVTAYNMLDCFDDTMPWGCPSDFNDDGMVDDADFVRFAAAYDELVCP